VTAGLRSGKIEIYALLGFYAA